MDKVTNNATASTDEGLRYRSNASQSKQQRPPPPKASMSMGYMPLLIDVSETRRRQCQCCQK
jgi:hypothetical protein